MPNLYEREPLPAEGARVQKIIIDSEQGILVEIEGHAHAMRGMPSEYAVRAIDIVKKLIRSPLLFFPHVLIKISMLALAPYILRAEFMQPCSRELRKIIGGDVGIIFSHIIEYDNAYRVRLQAMLASVTRDELIAQPVRALVHMSHVNWYDDYPSVHRKIRFYLLLTGLALLLPPCRRRWRNAWFHVEYRLLLPSPLDRYWTNLRKDYGINNIHRQQYRN